MKKKHPKLVPKQKRRLSKKRNIFIKFFLKIFYGLKKVFTLISRWCFLFFKKRPRTSAIFFIALLGTIFIVVGVNKIKTYSEKLLPNSIDIEINNPQVYNRVNEDISRALFYAQKNHERRSHFLNRINNILFSYDQIDQYWIRLGLDRNLQISATIQVPQTILETKGGDKFVISSTAKIIAKNPDMHDYPGLFYLSAPEIKLTWKPKSVQTKSKINNSNYSKQYITNKSLVNLPWLVNQTKLIYTHFQELGLNFLITKVAWNNDSGFQFALTSPTPQIEGHIINVYAGKDNLVPKIEKLKTMINDIERKNLLPTEIDLDYTDKASFKVSSSTNNPGKKS